MRALLVLAATCLSLAACSPQPNPSASTKDVADGEKQETTGFLHNANLVQPDWVPMGRTAEGGDVRYDRRSIKRDAAGIEAELVAELRHPDAHVEQFETTEVTETVTFQRERFVYRFRCGQSRFLVVERRLMGNEEAIARTITYPVNEESWRPLRDGGLAVVMERPACFAGKL
jgi:hypothetical protein